MVLGNGPLNWIILEPNYKVAFPHQKKMNTYELVLLLLVLGFLPFQLMEFASWSYYLLFNDIVKVGSW